VPRRRWREGRLELEPVTFTSMNELKRPRVVGGKIRTVTNAQHGRILQLSVEQAHDAALAVFVERGCRFVEKDPSRFVQEDPREGEALLLAERNLIELEGAVHLDYRPDGLVCKMDIPLPRGARDG